VVCGIILYSAFPAGKGIGLQPQKDSGRHIRTLSQVVLLSGISGDTYHSFSVFGGASVEVLALQSGFIRLNTSLATDCPLYFRYSAGSD
jgi:hypothetical protein